MKIDAYQSNSKRSYGVVVPAGTDLSKLTGEAATAIAKLQPLVKKKSDVELDSICKGDLLEHHQKQLKEHGASMQKIEVHFSEVGKYN